MDIRSICTRGTTALALAAMAALLGACGDNDAAGSREGFRIVPDEINYTGGVGSCPGNGTASPTKDRVYIYGGAGSYKIDNTQPGSVWVSTTSVSSPGGYFEVTTVGASCPFTAQIVVRDELGKTVTLTVTGEPGS